MAMSQLFQTTSILVLVILLILILAYLARRFIYFSYEGYDNKTKKNMHIIENKMLDMRTKLILCQCNGKEYLLTTNQQQVVLLDTYDIENRHSKKSSDTLKADKGKLKYVSKDT